MPPPDEAVVDRAGDAPVVEVPAQAGGDQTVVLHEEPPTYTLTVTYGDFEALFNDAAGVRGRQERMQATGFYYGAVDDDEGPVTRRCASHLRAELDHTAGHTLTDEEFAEQFQNLVRCIVRKADGTREPETDFSLDARMTFPGTFLFRNPDHLGNPLRRHRYNAEQTAWDGNRGLGKIPLMAHVTNTATGDAVSGIKVCFELIAPFDPHSGQLAYLSHISDATEHVRSPRDYVRSKLHHSTSRPYGYNCTTAKGGKTHDDVLGHLFAQGAVPGFPYEAGNVSRPNNFSVTVDTDDEGNSGVVFLPARTAGDCYKIKVHVIIDGREPIPSEIITSGVLSVWRNMRISRIINKPPHGAFAGAPSINAQYLGALGTIHTAVMRTEYAKAFHSLEVDHTAAHATNLTARNYRSAITYARTHAANPSHYDLNALVKDDFDSPFLFWLDTDTNYNANKTAPGAPNLDLTVPAGWNDVNAIIKSLYEHFMHYWSGNALPGVTIIRSEIGDSYSYWNDPRGLRPVGWNATTSGVAVRYRGCFLWYPETIYQNSMPYGITQNAMHEMGHTLFLRHHHTAIAGVVRSGGFPDNHDNDDYCLMGYLALNTNDYCGKCLLKLRGWDEVAI